MTSSEEEVAFPQGNDGGGIIKTYAQTRVCRGYPPSVLLALDSSPSGALITINRGA